jgi:hypothetical protein
LKKQFKQSMWPPTKAEAAAMNLQHCVRVFPQLQDTGGFFIAVFKKTAIIKQSALEHQVYGALPSLAASRP